MLICRPPPSSDRCHPGQEQLGVSSQLLSPNLSQPHEVAVGQEAAGCGQAGGLQLGLENLGEEGRGRPPCGLVGLSNQLEAREGGEQHPPGAHTAVMLTGQRARVAWERIKGGPPGEVALGLVFREPLARRYAERHCGLCKRSSLAQLCDQCLTACSHIPRPGSSWAPVQERRLSGSDSQVLSTQAGRQVKHGAGCSPCPGPELSLSSGFIPGRDCSPAAGPLLPP